MIDLSNIRYQVVAMDEEGNQYNIKDFIQNLGWEENEKEISMRSSFTVRNAKTPKGHLSDIIKPGCLVGIFASDGASFDGEVARGYVEEWNWVEGSSQNELKCTCYDELYKLQKSQDNRYYPSGTGTKLAVQSIFDDWGLPQGDYGGPDMPHGKTTYKNQYLSDILLEILDDAAKKGGRKCVIRAEKGYISVLPWGSNETVYVFKADNTQSFNQSVSTANLITRVKVVGQGEDSGKRSIEATLNGETRYGIRQRIYTRGVDETLSDANSAAKEILNKEGGIERKMTVRSPDVPFIRKGDRVYIMNGSASGHYYVKSIRHDVDTYSMTMEVEHAGTGQPDGESSDNTQKMEGCQVGDIVDFHGGTHYVSSYPGSRGYGAKAGKAKVTIKDGPGKAHPWHLVHVDGNSNVYGWVDDGTFE